MPVDIPHFDVPFSIPGSSARVVEQDSEEDVTNCVEVLLRYSIGFRIDVPEFGIPDPTFTEVPLDLKTVRGAIVEWEPRASALVEEQETDNPILRSVLVRVTGEANA
jgi:phage baseplate assembly protein W